MTTVEPQIPVQAQQPENPYLEGNYGPVHEEVTAFDLPVTGESVVRSRRLDSRLMRPEPIRKQVRQPANSASFMVKLGLPLRPLGLPGLHGPNSVGTPLRTRSGQPGREVSIHRLRKRMRGALAPGIRRHQLQVLLVRHIAELDQHRGHIGRLEHLEPRGLQWMLVQFGGVL